MASSLCMIVWIMQVEYPNNVHLIRGNHEAADINALFGFRIECIERMVRNLTVHILDRIFFSYLSLKNFCNLLIG